MKLLTPKEVNANTKADQARSVMRIQELAKAEEKARKGLADAEMEFNVTLSRNRAQWLKEEEEHRTIVIALKSETQGLEARRAVALEPIDKEKAQLDIYKADLEKKSQELDSREERLDDQAELLQDKLDEVGSREQNVTLREQQLTVAEDGVRMQQDQIRTSSRDLNKQLTDYRAFVAGEEKKLQKEKDRLFLWQRSLEGREFVLKEKDKQFVVRSKKLDDREKTLEAGFAELRQKMIK